MRILQAIKNYLKPEPTFAKGGLIEPSRTDGRQYVITTPEECFIGSNLLCMREDSDHAAATIEPMRVKKPGGRWWGCPTHDMDGNPRV